MPPVPPVPPPAPAAPPPTLTPEQKAQAQNHYRLGEAAFLAEKYDIALDEFTTAYEISREPDLLYNLHKVALKLGQREMAANYLREYRVHRPTEAAAIDRELAEVSAPPPPAPPVAVVETQPQPAPTLGPSRSSGVVLLVLGGAFAITGAAVLGSSAALATDTGAGMTAQRSSLVSGAFLIGTGGAALIGGLVISLQSRKAR